MAESLGDETPYRLQSLLGGSSWNADRAVTTLQQMVVDRVAGEPGDFILDYTGFVKKGDKSVGVQSQYCGRTGKIGDCQNDLFLAFESVAGALLIDRQLYLPKSWSDTKRRRREASVPDDISYKNKAELGIMMIEGALTQGFHAAWVLGDSIDDKDPNLRRFLENRRIPYILGVPGNVRLWRDLRQWKLSDIARKIPMRWAVKSYGEGTQKQRRFRWAVYEFSNGLPRRLEAGGPFSSIGKRSR